MEDKSAKDVKIKTWKCSVCGYIYEGVEPPEKCPICNAPAEKFYQIYSGK